MTRAARVLPLMNIQIKTKTLKLRLLLNVNTILGIHVVVCDNAFIKVIDLFDLTVKFQW